ncbi:signal peptide-containing protein [Theileria equi strain WA]|uniref:Signal peptide-containing protein n=1 Tax=Theileria equi strain WA TaxID=1537102 RepID=L0AV55_THEEQ|nr:signal peptide-containing protein [Theileria equi strain WA]AFZ79492.1 signal peptide-containing protein [Theileria equi strain WA]|eukprot:XP_004829158.1 signal peptide-containing protein [Theileria equi strain WA]
MNAATVSFAVFALIGSIPSLFAEAAAKDIKININKSGVTAAKDGSEGVINTFQSGAPEGFTTYYFALGDGNGNAESDKFNCRPAHFNGKTLMVGNTEMTLSGVTAVSVFWKHATPILIHFRQPGQNNGHVYYKYKGGSLWEEVDLTNKSLPLSGTALEGLLAEIAEPLNIPEGDKPVDEIGGFTTLSVVSISVAAFSALYFL